MPDRSPLVLFALDSADIDLVRTWAEAGFLPNINSILTDGQVMSIDQPDVAFDEIGSWLSLYSGISQHEHGFYCSRCPEPGNYQLQITRFEDTGATPFWAAEGNDSPRSAILDLPEPFLAEELNGIQLVGFNMHQETYAWMPPRSDPPELAQSVIDTMGNYAVVHYDDYKKPASYFRGLKDQALDMMRTRNAAFRELVSSEAFDFIAIGFGEMHDLGHLMWPYDEQTSDQPAADPALKHGLREVYERVDAELGGYLEQLPEAANVMVVSTYGLKHQYPTAEFGEILIDRLGLRVKKDPEQQKRTALNLARAVIPQSVRMTLSHYLPRSVQQKLVHGNFSDTHDFAASRVYSVPSFYSNWLRVNLAGRDPMGIVPLEEYTALLEELEDAFRAMTHPETGESVIAAVLRPNESPRIDRMTSKVPDLVVHWKSSKTYIDEVDHPSGRIRQPKPNFMRNSYHRFPGFVAWKGPDARAGHQGSCSLIDLAPTCMDLLGIEIPSSLAGRSLRS